jgi:ribonuclease VapC
VIGREGAAVFDASALLALLLDEPGADRAASALGRGACMSTLNWAEVLARLIERGDTPEAAEAKGWQVTAAGTLALVAFDEAQARETARLRPSTRTLGLSLADRACLALGRRQRLPVITADRAWRALRLSIKIEVIR